MTIPPYRGILWQYRTVLIFLISPNTTINPLIFLLFNNIVIIASYTIQRIYSEHL